MINPIRFGPNDAVNREYALLAQECIDLIKSKTLSPEDTTEALKLINALDKGNSEEVATQLETLVLKYRTN